MPDLERLALVELFESTHGFRWRDNFGYTGRQATPSRLGLDHYAMPPAWWAGVEIDAGGRVSALNLVSSFV